MQERKGRGETMIEKFIHSFICMCENLLIFAVTEYNLNCSDNPLKILITLKKIKAF